MNEMENKNLAIHKSAAELWIKQITIRSRMSCFPRLISVLPCDSNTRWVRVGLECRLYQFDESIRFWHKVLIFQAVNMCFD